MTEAERKFAFIVKTDTNRTSETLTSLEQAFHLADAGYDVRIYLDAVGTTWAEHLADGSENPVTVYLERAAERGLLAGGCGLCAVKFETADDLRATGIDTLGDADEHGIDVVGLADDGFELVVVS